MSVYLSWTLQYTQEVLHRVTPTYLVDVLLACGRCIIVCAYYALPAHAILL